MTTAAKIDQQSYENHFAIKALKSNFRIQNIVLDKVVIDEFRARIFSEWDLQAIEYKPFLRFVVADLLDEICGRQLAKSLNSILKDRNQGAFVLSFEGQLDTTENSKAGFNNVSDFYVILATAISHLIGIPNHDSMYGKYYARFTVENTENSDSYLRQAYHRLELHNDGTYVDEQTDFVLMMKMDEQHMQGGETLLLHIDDWQDLDQFYQHNLAKQSIPWGSPKSKNVDIKVNHSVFFEDEDGKPQMSFIDQFVEPQNREQGLFLFEMGKSLEQESNTTAVELPVGSMVVINNHRWLHGRDKFEVNPKLKRELLRQRGHFTVEND